MGARMTDIERRKWSAYWYAVGRCDGEGITDVADEFADFCERQASEYYARNVTHLSCIPDQWTQFIEQQDERDHAETMPGRPEAEDISNKLSES